MPTGINSVPLLVPVALLHGGFTDPDLCRRSLPEPAAAGAVLLLADSLNPQVAQALLGAMAGVAAVLMTWRIAMRVLPFDGGWQVAVSTGAAVLAMVGAGFPQ